MIIRRERYKTGEKALTKDEYNRLLAVIDTLEDEVMLKLTVSTGIRREDVVGVKWADIDEKELSISFQEHKKRRIWKVYIGQDMMQLLVKYRNSLGKEIGKEVLPFCGRTAHYRLQRLCIKAGIPKRPFHALRATCIKFCQAAGWSVEATAKHVGDTILVIQEHYTTPSQSEMKEFAQGKPII